MSASKKKVQRREAVDVEKVNQAQAEQAAYKKKVRLYTVIGIVIAVLVVVLLVWNSGIFQKNASAATVGETEFSVSELSYFYYSSRYMFTMYGYLDSNKGDDEQMYDQEKGTTWQDYLLGEALTQAQNVQSRYQEALKNGYSDADVADEVAAQTESVKTSAAANGYSYKTYLAAIYGRYMTPAAFEKILVRDLLATKYYNDTALANYDSYTAEDLETYYAEHQDEVDTITYSYLYFKADEIAVMEGEEHTEEELAALKKAEMDEAKAKAEEVLAAYHEGTPVVKLIDQYKPTSSNEEYSVVGTTSISSLYRDALLALDANEGAVVENENAGYYVVIFHSRARNEELTANVRHILLRAETTTDAAGKVVPPTEEAWAAAQAKAEEVLAEFNAGAKTAEAFGELANKYSTDGGSNTNGGLYENVAEGNFVDEFNAWLFTEGERVEGDTAIVRHEGATTESNPYWGCHVTYFQGWDEAEWMLTVRETLANDFMSDWTEELAEAYPAALTNGARNIGK